MLKMLGLVTHVRHLDSVSQLLLLLVLFLLLAKFVSSFPSFSSVVLHFQEKAVNLCLNMVLTQG